MDFLIICIKLISVLVIFGSALILFIFVLDKVLSRGN